MSALLQFGRSLVALSTVIGGWEVILCILYSCRGQLQGSIPPTHPPDILLILCCHIVPIPLRMTAQLLNDLLTNFKMTFLTAVQLISYGAELKPEKATAGQ